MSSTAQKNKATTQKFIEIEKIDGEVVFSSGKSACLIVEVNSTNFALLSRAEQDTKIYSYAALLNSLSFSIQIYIRSKKLDISSYLRLLDSQAETSTNQLLATQIRLYKDFVKELVKVNTVLDKKFYIVIPYSYLEAGVAGAKNTVKSTSQDAFISAAKASLKSKAEAIYSQLARLNLRAKTLQEDELVKLFYEIFNGYSVETNQITDDIKTPIIRGGNQ